MKQKVLNVLDELKTDYTNYEHDPVFSCDEAKGINVPGKRVKSLLLRNKHASKYYMVVLEDYKQLDSNSLRHTLGENKLSFASEERMIKKIGIKPGNVSPFANINDKQRDILVIFDATLKGGLVGFHPGQNDNTVVLNNNDVEKYLEYLGVEFQYLDL